MGYDWKFREEGIDWHELSRLYKIAPLGEKKPQDLQTVFRNSLFKCFIFHQGQLVGAGRALADGVDCSYLCDIAVHPDHQGEGLGKDIVAKLVELSRGHNKIILYTSPDKEGFYEKLGFKHMTAALAMFDDPDYAKAHRLIEEH